MLFSSLMRDGRPFKSKANKSEANKSEANKSEANFKKKCG